MVFGSITVYNSIYIDFPRYAINPNKDYLPLLFQLLCV